MKGEFGMIEIGSIITSINDPLDNIGIVEEINKHTFNNNEVTIITSRQRGILVARNSKNVIDLTAELKYIISKYTK
jgi:hypothetical protein